MMDLTSWTPEYFCENATTCSEQLTKPEVRATIPLLNCSQLHNLRDNTLVRFRGMIQDMQDPECFLERYEVRRKGDTSELIRVQDGRYRDVLVMNKDEETVDLRASSNKYGERRSMFVISIPGYNGWAVECEEKLSGTGGRLTVGQVDVSSPKSVKRPLTEDEDMDVDEAGGPKEHKFKKPLVPGAPSSTQGSSTAPSSSSNGTNTKILSAEYLLNSPIPDRPSKACLVKLYSNLEEFTLNSLVDVVGFLSVDPALDGSTDQMEDEDELSEHQATHPPPSLIPRIHAISVQKLKHINPLLVQEPCTTPPESSDIWRDIQNLLTQCLFGDRVAAEYLLCHLLSSVYIRNELESLGQFSLNLSNVPAEVLPRYTVGLYEILELLLPASHYFPMTLENMNMMQFVPKKDYTTNKLTSGLLQLAPHTHLLLDETRLQTGKLESSGVEAIQNIAHLIKNQKLKYNFQFYQLEFNSDVPVLVLSEGKSMLPTNCHVPLIPDQDAIGLIDETLKAGKHFSQPKLTEMRRFLTLQRIREFDMKTFDPEIIQNDFLRMRKEVDASAEDLHSLLVLARLLGLSRGKVSLDSECWEHAKELEQERKRRVELFAKKKNEP